MATDTASAAPTYDQVVAAWNAQADEYNQWDELAEDEKIDWTLKFAQPTPPAADQEPFGYFRAEPFGWTDCAEADEGAVALYERPTPPAAVEPPRAFTPRQRERLFYNRPSNVGKGLSMADWHRTVQYLETTHGIGIKKENGNG